MELTALIESLSRPEAYPHAVDAIEVRQTHISVVFLAGEFAYKLKKPVALGFLDFSTLSKRKHFCDEEVRLNRRLAPSVYLGVIPITMTDGHAVVGGIGDAVDWLVKMRRVPESATLEQRLQTGAANRYDVEALARRLAAFHAQAERGPHVSRFGHFPVVAGNARENFDQAVGHIGGTVSRRVFDRARELTEAALARLRPLIIERAEKDVPCDTHGDLHLDHVYLFPDRTASEDLVVIDCIEFNERFRYADPVADVAFLAMDLRFHQRGDLADAFADAYFAAAADREGLPLLSFYEAYRAIIRAKVEGITASEPEVPAEVRASAVQNARAHWLLALGLLEAADDRPCLLLLGGLPGAGKSTLARAIAEHANFTVIRTDEVRKQLAGMSPDAQAAAAFGEGLYAAEHTARTYDECLRRARVELAEGHRVIVDASFGDDERRSTFADAAARMCVPAAFIECRAAPAIAMRRIAARVGDASDADSAVYQKASQLWQPIGEKTASIAHRVDSGRPTEEALAEVRAILRSRGLES